LSICSISPFAFCSAYSLNAAYTFLIAGIFIAIIAVTFLIIYMFPWAKEKNERSEGWNESGFILKADEGKGNFLIAEKNRNLLNDSV